LIGIKHQNPILLQTNPNPLLYSSNAHCHCIHAMHTILRRKKKSEVKKNWQFTLLEWTTTCAKLDLFTFSSNNVNTYVWTQIARNKLYNYTSLKNTKCLLSTILKKQWAKKVVMKRPRFLTSHANVSKIYKSTQHKNAHLQRGANDKNINHVLLK
jgi:hypothetical protein